MYCLIDDKQHTSEETSLDIQTISICILLVQYHTVLAVIPTTHTLITAQAKKYEWHQRPVILCPVLLTTFLRLQKAYCSTRRVDSFNYLLILNTLHCHSGFSVIFYSFWSWMTIQHRILMCHKSEPNQIGTGRWWLDTSWTRCILRYTEKIMLQLATGNTVNSNYWKHV